MVDQRWFGMLGLSYFLLCGGVFAGEDLSGKFAILEELQGTVQVSHDGGSQWQATRRGDFLAEGDSIKTDATAEATVVFDPKYLNTVVVNENTIIRVSRLRGETGTQLVDFALHLTAGTVNALLNGLQPGDVFTIRTPTAIIAARGTEFMVSYDTGTSTTSVEVYEGSVTVRETKDREPGKGEIRGILQGDDSEEGGRLIPRCTIRLTGGIVNGVFDLEKGQPDDEAQRQQIRHLRKEMKRLRHELKSAARTTDPILLGYSEKEWRQMLHEKQQRMQGMLKTIQELSESVPH
jgi:outer membrane lipoprotein-sorting protein